MRKLTIAGMVAMAAVGFLALTQVQAEDVPVAQQEEVTYTGCLGAGEEEGQFHMTDATGPGETQVDRIELMPAEDVDMTPHVGHTVSVTGTEMESEEETMHLMVSSLSHVAASCDM